MPGVLEHYAGMSVLIVDDNASNVALLKALAREEGLRQIYCETDSRQVRTKLIEYHPDIVLLDLHMPNVDGLALIAQIQEFAAGDYLPILVLTADTTSEARDQALSHGAHDFLTKPIDAVETTLRMANLLETRELYTTLRRAHLTPARAAPRPPSDPDEIKRRIQDVLQSHRISPVFQPIIHIATSTAVGYEGLSRFPNVQHGGPERWFADAFTVGLGTTLEWLAAETIVPFFETGPADTFLAINMSPATILRFHEATLCEPALLPRLVIELNEHVPIQDYGAVHEAFAHMRARGARLAADDLGSGYAGFRQLIDLKPDIIKLDVSMIRGIHRNLGQRAIANALVTFARDVGASVIAEGVEQEGELDALHSIGVTLAQGYHLGRPVPMSGLFAGSGYAA